ncbi:Polysaccharide deacetylase [hydrothermal vent metagenome]|uniref:Polysaccharide deacetylase n=1 Tax=hydrothermal vent metagenome TaxID=652676 RepID=A0A3B0UF11_9ZZZZ
MLHRIPKWFQYLFPGYMWNKQTNEKVIYLTFDDGPIPEITEWVLSILNEYKVKATFFVVGENVERFPEIFKEIVNKGHSIGNHTHHHLKGWSTSVHNYVNDVELCSSTIEKHSGKTPALFRPPYGRIKPKQAKSLRREYRLVMWDTLTVDYDKNLDNVKCLQNSVNATHSGSIVVFHDSVKAQKNLKYVLPKYIAHFLSLGYSFKAL